MTPDLLLVRLLIPAALTVCLPLLRAEEAPVFPTKIVMTEADCREINDKKSLRGRPLSPNIATSWERSLATWDGVQVFTGRKPDVLAWFRSGLQGGVRGAGSFQNVRYIGEFQYDLLCSALLQTADLGVIRAVLWSPFPTGDYVLPDWRRFVNDQRLTTTERIVAWTRSFSSLGDEWERSAEEFWRRFAGTLTGDDLIELHQRWRRPWGMFDDPGKFAGGMTREKARALLLPLVRREYLSVTSQGQGNLVGDALEALLHVDAPDTGRVTQMAVENLISWDALGDERSTVVWRGIRPGLSTMDDGTAVKLKALIRAAKVPLNAAEAFYAYPRSPAGRKESEQTRLAAYLRSYLDMAFERSGPFREYPFVRALVATQALAEELTRMLRDQKADVTVTTKEIEVLKNAWQNAPRALEHLIVEDKKKGAP